MYKNQWSLVANIYGCFNCLKVIVDGVEVPYSLLYRDMKYDLAIFVPYSYDKIEIQAWNRCSKVKAYIR